MLSATFRTLRAAAMAALAIAAIDACGGASDASGPSGPTGSGHVFPGLTIVSGGGFTDTIGSPDPTPLTITLGDPSGNPLAGVPMDIESFHLFFRRHGDPPSSGTDLLHDTTDASGTVVVDVVLGLEVGTQTADIFVTSRNLHTSTTYGVLAGHAVRPAIAPGAMVNGHLPPFSNYAMLVNGRQTVNAFAEDRGGNPTVGTLTYTAVGGVTVDATGTLAAGAQPDTGEVYAHLGDSTAQARVSVLPALRVAAYRSAPSPRIVLANLDTSAERAVATPHQWLAGPVWAPDGAHVAYADVDPAGHPQIFVVDTLGDAPVAVIADNAAFSGIAGLAYSPMDSSFYMSAAVNGGAYRAWRVPVGGAPPAGLSDSVALDAAIPPSVSADGRRLLLVRDDPFADVVDLVSGGTTTISAQFESAALSADGARVFYVAPGIGGVYVVDVAGSVPAVISPWPAADSTLALSREMAASADGQWVAAAPGFSFGLPTMVVFPLGGGGMLITPFGGSTYAEVALHP